MKRAIAILLLLCIVLSFCGCIKSKAVLATETAIELIGDVTIDSGDDIAEAEEMFYSLSRKEQDSVEGYYKLEKARKSYNKLCVDTAEQNISNIGEVTVDSGSKIENARAFYDSLGSDLKADVRNYDKLEAAEKQYEKALLVDSILIKNYEQISTGAISELVSIRTAYEWYYSTYLAAVLDVLTTTSAATDKVINISDIDLANSYVAICRSDNRVDIYFRCGDNTIYGMQCWPSRGYVQAGTVESNMLITEYVELLSEGNIIDEYTHIPISDLSEAFDDISDVISD